MQTPILCQKLQLHPHVQLCRPRRRTQLERKTSVLHIISIIMSLNFVGIGQQEAGIVPFGVDFKNPNFAKVAEAMGAKGIRLEEAGDVKDAPRR
jgi:pyruvate dehydrogenase (quinone)